MLRIDVHAHGPENLVDARQAELMMERLVEEMDACSFDETYLICMGRPPHYIPSAEDLRFSNEECRRWATWSKGRIRSWAVVNPRLGDQHLSEFEQQLESGDFIGLKLWKACRASDPVFFPYVEKCIEHDVPILIHSYFLTHGNAEGESGPDDVRAVALEYPEARILMAHCGGEWERGIRTVQDLPNVWVDASGRDDEIGMMESALQRLGEDRICFGSDTPYRPLSSQLSKVFSLGLSDNAQEKILGGNTLRLVKGKKHED